MYDYILTVLFFLICQKRRPPFAGKAGKNLAALRRPTYKYSRPVRACALKFNGKGKEKRFELYSMRAQTRPRLALRAMLRRCRNARGATIAASLESELSDWACSVICAAACFASYGAVQISTPPTKKRTPIGVLFVG